MIEPDTIGFLLADVVRMQRAEFERRIASAGLELTPGEARALLNISARAGGRQNEIAEKMGIEPMTMSGYIDKLETLGLVERTPDPSDRRARNITLTERAAATLAAIRRQSNAMLDDMLHEVSAADREVLRTTLKKIKASLKDMGGSQDAA